MQGHTLSRLHVAHGLGQLDTDSSDPAIPAVSHQDPNSAGSAETADVGSASDREMKRSGKEGDGSRHVHMAGDLEQGRGHHTGEPDLWASMLRKKIGADPEKLDSQGSETMHQESGLSRLGSQTALLGSNQVSSSEVEVHSPHHHAAQPAASAMHHQGGLQQPLGGQPLADQPQPQEALSGFRRLGRLLMHTTHLAPHPPPHPPPENPTLQGGQPLPTNASQQPSHTSMWRRVGQGTKIMAAFKKKSSIEPGGLPGVTADSEGRALQTAGSTASDRPLLPAGTPNGIRCIVFYMMLWVGHVTLASMLVYHGVELLCSQALCMLVRPNAHSHSVHRFHIKACLST